MVLSSMLSLFLLSSSASAIPIPQTEPAYEPEPSQRGTFTLVWGCVTTLGLCIWTAMHPNVVPMRGTFPPVYYKATLMVGALVFPEIMMCMAIAQWWLARNVHTAWKDAWKKEDPRREWLGMSGAYFVVMGGYTLETKASNKEDDRMPERTCLLRKKKPIKRKQDDELVTTITAKGFMELLKKKIIQGLINNGDLNNSHFDHFIIEDKGKSSTIAKTIVVIQVLWMIVQIGGRVREGLPVTLLEASVAVQIPYSIISFFVWWNKPLDVGEPIAIPLGIESPLGHNTQTESEAHSIDELFITEKKNHDSFLQMALRAAYDVTFYFGHKFEFASAITAIINGALHACMWNAYFPTPIERLLWRISCIGMGFFPVLYFILVFNQGFEEALRRATFSIRNESGGILMQQAAIFKSVWKFCADFVDAKQQKWYSICGRVTHLILLGLGVNAYIMCILYLTVESFVSLRELPAGAYTLVQWSSIIPHL